MGLRIKTRRTCQLLDVIARKQLQDLLMGIKYTS